MLCTYLVHTMYIRVHTFAKKYVHVCTQTSLIEISIEAGILRSGKSAIHASVGLRNAVVFLAQSWYGILVSSLRMQLLQWLITAVVS